MHKLIMQIGGPITDEKMTELSKFLQGKAASLQNVVYGLALVDIDPNDYILSMISVQKDGYDQGEDAT